MKVTYIRGSEESGARFWLARVGWEPSEAAKKIARYFPKETVIADVGGGHGRDSLWLVEHGFECILLEPNKHSVRFAKRRAKENGLTVEVVNATAPRLPIRSETVDVVDFYWTLHNIPDENKPLALREVYRILKPNGVLMSASFGYWEERGMPSSIYPVVKREDFRNIHLSAGFKALTRVHKKSDRVHPYEKYWYGEFKR